MSGQKEIFACYTGLALSDQFFCGQQHMTTDDLMPVIHELIHKCDGMINEPGIYAFNLQVVKLK